MTHGEKQIRVAMVGPYPLQGEIRGGVEGVSATLVRGLGVIPGVEVMVITAATGSPPVAGPGEPSVIVVPQSKWIRRPTLYWAEHRRVAQCIRRENPDVVHVQGQNWYAVAALAAGYPTVVTLHGMAHKEMHIADSRSAWRHRTSKRIRSLFNARFERETLRLARHVVVISPYVRECIEKRTQACLYEVPNPVEDAFFELQPCETPDRLLFAGFVEPRKGLDRLLEAMTMLSSRRPNVSLHIAGAEVDEGYARALHRYVSSHGLERNVRFLGQLDQQCLLREYSECCALTLPSREEASPLAVQQAMAAGKLVVATAVGGIPHLVEDGVSGCLVHFGDVRQLADTLDVVLNDHVLRQRMGAAARRLAEEQFRAEAVARRTVNVYRQVLKVHEGGQPETASTEYSEQEEALVSERLRGLGYVE